MSIFKNRTVIGVLCIIVALVICFGITPLFNQSISQKTEIVRVVKAIDAGEQITADSVQSVEVGSYNLPSDVLHDTASVVGKYAVADLAAGDYILSSKLSTEPAAEKEPTNTNYIHPAADGRLSTRSKRLVHLAPAAPGAKRSNGAVGGQGNMV